MDARVVGGVLAALVVGCGGSLAPEASAPEPDAGSASPGVPSFGDAAVTLRAPVACVACDRNDACGPQAACVVPASGAAYCAPGCSKDGFCPSDRTCTWVSDPAGASWHACLPASDPCAPPVAVTPGAGRHAGTW
jgi:hypothetical protein